MRIGKEGTIWKKALIGLGALIALFAAVVATRPAAFSIERAATIDAPAEIVFALVDDFHAWRAWSPWEKLDPAMQRSYEGAATGKGAVYSWEGSDAVGAGRMTIEDTRGNQEIQIELEFLKPFPATNQAVFRFEPEGDATRVTWTMRGENGFAGKLFSLVMDMDAMVGKDFESGLAALGTLARAESARREAELAETEAPAPTAAPAPTP